MEDRSRPPAADWGALEFRKPIAVVDNNWLAAIALHVAFFLIVAVAQIAAEPGAGSTLLARVFAAALVPTLILGWVIRRGSKAFIAGNVLFLWLLVGSLVGIGATIATHRAMGDQMIATVQGFRQAIGTGEVLADVAPVADTDEARGIALISQLLVDMTKANSEYLKALKHAGWDKALDPASMAVPGGFDQSRERIAATIEAFNAYAGRIRHLVRALESRAAASDIPPGMAVMLREAALGPKIEAALSMEQAIIDASSALIAVLAKLRPEYEDGAWMFRTEGELAEFRAAVADLDAAIAKQEEHQAAVFRGVDERISQFRNGNSPR